MDPIKRYYIFAQTYTHACFCARQKGLDPYSNNVIYVNNVKQLYGIVKDEFVVFIFYTTFPYNPNYIEIMEYVRIIESKVASIRLETQMISNSFWWKLVHLEPTLLRGMISGLIGLLGAIGILVAPGLPDTILGFWVPIMALIQVIITRPVVTANARVAVLVPDPINAPNVVEAGEAVTNSPAAGILTAARMAGKSNEEK